MLELLGRWDAWAALASLTALEIVLGIDNVVFIAVLVGRLEPGASETARRIGLALAFVFRIALLFSLTWLMGLSRPVLAVFDRALSWHDLILLAGGLFLIAKAVHEMHSETELRDQEADAPAAIAMRAPAALAFIVGQIAVIDLVFSLDSIVTAIGMAQDIRIMAVAILIAIIVTYAAARPVSRFIAAHPTTKVLALAFLLLIGVTLMADGLGFEIPKGYIYFAMGFAALVEAFNTLALRRRRSRK